MLTLKKEKYEMSKTPLESYIEKMVDEAINRREFELKEEEARLIARKLEPIIDKLVAEQVKIHFKLLAEHYLNYTKPKEEDSGYAKDT
jgi:hypothetical protein